MQTQLGICEAFDLQLHEDLDALTNAYALHAMSLHEV